MFNALQAETGAEIAALFAADPDRFARFSVQMVDILFDFSRTSMTPAARAMLLDLARAQDVEGWRDRMFAGARINTTEDRRVLHTALRLPEGTAFRADDEDIAGPVLATRARAYRFAEAVRDGRYSGAGGPFTDVVNIGIGGSDLGPHLVADALTPYRDGPRLHFVSNVDGAHLTDVFAGLDLTRTLVLVASKTFTTAETMANAHRARALIEAAVGEAAAPGHFAALTSAVDLAAAFGVPEERCFGFADWVGGRYSLWSAIGLSVMMGVGPARFDALLAGAHEMDEHFRTAPLDANLPVLMALTGIWHRSACRYPSRCIAPYDQRLALLPAYLQQLDMESNGKGVGREGNDLAAPACPVVWGSAGTNGQHAFFQLLHQGEVHPVEFLVAATGHEAEMMDQHDQLLANCLAQAEALMRGRDAAEVVETLTAAGWAEDAARAAAPNRRFPGNRPSTLLLYRRLDPRTLGRLLAAFEHRTFVEGVIWGVNSFDQWGVELGKELARSRLAAIRDPGGSEVPVALAGPVAHLQALRETPGD
ncbi:MAG: glucose-6-phosphate isomerase [Pseudomonadota bacterium]